MVDGEPEELGLERADDVKLEERDSAALTLGESDAREVALGESELRALAETTLALGVADTLGDPLADDVTLTTTERVMTIENVAVAAPDTDGALLIEPAPMTVGLTVAVEKGAVALDDGERSADADAVTVALPESDGMLAVGTGVPDLRAVDEPATTEFVGDVVVDRDPREDIVTFGDLEGIAVETTVEEILGVRLTSGVNVSHGELLSDTRADTEIAFVRDAHADVEGVRVSAALAVTRKDSVCTGVTDVVEASEALAAPETDALAHIVTEVVNESIRLVDDVRVTRGEFETLIVPDDVRDVRGDTLSDLSSDEEGRLLTDGATLELTAATVTVSDWVKVGDVEEDRVELLLSDARLLVLVVGVTLAHLETLGDAVDDEEKLGLGERAGEREPLGEAVGDRDAGGERDAEEDVVGQRETLTEDVPKEALETALIDGDPDDVRVRSTVYVAISVGMDASADGVLVADGESDEDADAEGDRVDDEEPVIDDDTRDVRDDESDPDELGDDDGLHVGDAAPDVVADTD